jgi:hypothetical protein
MNRIWHRLWTVVALTQALGAAPALAEPALIWLKNGLRLHGDVSVGETEVVLRNELGEVHYPRQEVIRLEFVALQVPVTAPTTPATTQAAEEAPGSPAEQLPASQPELPAGLPAPPLLSALDIQRLKMQELRLDGPPEEVRVQFATARDRRELPRELLRELAARPDYQPRWGQILLEGRPAEMLQLIVAQTGTRYAGRINIVSDPEVFATFRTQVLPLVMRGCARSGCHAGPRAQVFRLPSNADRNEEAAYTTFVILDSLQTRHGPLINRDDPAASALLSYLLPPENNPQAHPPVGKARRVEPVLRTRRTPAYQKVLEWIDSLRTPHTSYGLDYVVPFQVHPADPAATRPTTQP